MTTLKQILERQEKGFTDEVDRLIARSLRDPECKPLTELKSHILQDKLELLEAVVGMIEEEFTKVVPLGETRAFKNRVVSKIKELKK